MSHRRVTDDKDLSRHSDIDDFRTSESLKEFRLNIDLVQMCYSMLKSSALV